MSKLDQLQILLHSKGLWAKKSLGQNFLVDEKALATIAEAGDLKSSDYVMEVGPGTGFLTEQLIQKAGHVTSVELDSDMVELLKEQFKFSENLEVIHGDILKLPLPSLSFPRKRESSLSAGKLDSRFRGNDRGDGHDTPYKVIANIPYYITSPILKYFLQSTHRPTVMVLLVQKEVAEKICGITGKSVITIETQVFGKPEIVAIVPSSSFYPAPKVESAVLKINVFDTPLVEGDKLKDFFRIVKFGFSQKRKMLANSLGAGLHKKPTEVREILIKAGIAPDVRAEDLKIEDWNNLLLFL